jgi:outer membrane protein assembly factor BamB
MRPSRPRLLLATAAATLVSVLVGLVASRVDAVGTRSFELDDAASLAAGELHRTAVHSDGRVTTSVELRRIALPDDVALVWSSARAQDGTLYLGTGHDGRIYRVRGDAVDLFASTGQLVVTALAVGAENVLYAGTIPEGRIFAIDAGGAVRELARPDGTEHVWSLVWDPRRRTLFAATGPEGRIFAIDPGSGAVDLWWDASAAHVMSLVLAPDGTLYAGTSDDALVVRMTSPGRADVVYDFPGNEITSLAFRGGRLAVAANEFPEPPAITASASGPTKHSATSPRAARPRPGKARVWTVSPDGRAERVWAHEEGQATQVQLASDGTIYAALGYDGRVVRIAPDRTSAVWIDVDERQVLTIDLLGSDPYLATGDGAALYRVLPERPRSAIWQSKVLDAEFLARWGQLTWRGSGAIEFQTRSGNTERPDGSWSEWSSSLTSPGPIRSPAARFLQIRALFFRDPDATIRAVTAYYLPQNQRPVVTEVGVKARTTKRGTGAGSSEGSDRDAPPAPSAIVGLTWKVDNPDSDRLRFRLRYREEGQTRWREILREHEVLSATEYAWNTSAVPDGWYVIQVEASDELSNPAPLALRSTLESEPILVDNHAPTIVELRAVGGRITGRAVDGVGPIARLEYAVDGGEWRLFFPVDDLLDTRDERFELDLGGEPPGSHIVAVRATDAGGNVGSAEVTLTVAGEGGGARSRGRVR